MKYKTINEQYFDNTKTSKKEIDNVKSTLSDFGFGYFTSDASHCIKKTDIDVYVKMFFDIVKKAEHFINRSNTISKCINMKLIVDGIYDENLIESDVYGKEAECRLKHYFEYMMKKDTYIEVKCKVVYNNVSFSEYLKFIKGLFNILYVGANQLSSHDASYCVEPNMYLYNDLTEDFNWENTKVDINKIVQDTYLHEFHGGVQPKNTERNAYHFQYRGGVNLSRDASTKIIRDFKVGDVLYSTSDGKLTDVSEGNVPIGICVSVHVPETAQQVPYANFVSINYMSAFTRETGSIRAVTMPWGNVGAYIEYGIHGNDGSEEHYMGILDAMNAAKITLPNVGWRIYDGVSIPIVCTNLYHTLGTKPGNWYLPWSRKNDDCAMFAFISNFAKISESRKSVVGEGYKDGIYWSATECNGGSAYTAVTSDKLRNGFSSLMNKKDKEHYVIAYLKVY